MCHWEFTYCSHGMHDSNLDGAVWRGRKKPSLSELEWQRATHLKWRINLSVCLCGRVWNTLKAPMDT